MNDFTYAVRQVIARPSLSVVVILMLALGIGATTAMYSLFHQILQRPLAVPAPHELVNLSAPGPKWGMTSCSTAGPCSQVFSYAMFRDLEREQGVFTGIAAHRQFGANLAYEGSTLSGSGLLVSGEYFSVLNLRAAAGRLISVQDEPQLGESAVVVLSHAYWQNSFGGDPDVVGRRLAVNGQDLEIIGVAPQGFAGTTIGVRAQVFVPLTMTHQMMPTFPQQATESRTAYWLYLFARLRPGLSVEQADAELNGYYNGVLNEVEANLNSFMPENVLADFRERRIEFSDGARGQSSVPTDFERPLQILLGLTALVLLIVCVNVANLMLARGATRAGEIAVRASVGASRWQLVRQLLIESMVLALIGAAVAIPVAAATLTLITAVMPDTFADVLQVGLDLRSMAAAGVLALGTVLLFGLFPAWQAARTEPGLVLKGQSGQSPGGRGMVRFRGVLATVQIAFSMVLLVLAGLFSLSLANVTRVDIGMDVESVVGFVVSPRLNGYSPERTMQIYDAIEREVGAQPGVLSVGSSMVRLVSGSNWNNSLTVEGFPGGPGVDTNSSTNEVGIGFLESLSIPLVAGRNFNEGDVIDAPRVAIVNQAFLRKFDLGLDAVGTRMSADSADGAELNIEIVGIMEDATYSEVKDDVPPVYLLPRRQNNNIGTMTFYVRAAMEPEQLMLSLPRIIAQVDADLPVSNLMPMSRTVEDNFFLDRMVAVLSTGFALLATLLAAIGLYGVLAYSVAQRTREIGLRLALGAAPARLRWMVLRQIGWMGVIGGIAGIAGAVALGRTAEALLFGLEGWNLSVLLISCVLLSAIVLLSGYLPARRASQVHPMEALRYE